MVGIEGLGNAVTGSMVARAAEPEHGEAGAGAQDATCLNCGAALVGPYCHACGQKGHVHRTLHGFGHDLLHSVLHFEGKIWRTLPMLAWQPGEVTRRYIAGERARFVSPIALFLFSVFLMFAVFSAVGGPFRSRADGAATVDASQAMQREIAARGARIARLEQERRVLVARHEPTRVVDAQLDLLRRDQSIVGTAERIRTTASQGSGRGKGIDLSDLEANTGWPRLDAAIRHAAENPSLLAYKLQSNAYKFSWALIPISVPFLWLLLLHRRRHRREYRAYDHVVFVTYSIASISLLLVALSLIRPIIGDWLAPPALAVIPPLHMYRQLRGAYGLSRFSAAWRAAVLLFFALIAASLFFLLLLTLGLLG